MWLNKGDMFQPQLGNLCPVFLVLESRGDEGKLQRSGIYRGVPEWWPKDAIARN